MLSALTLLLAPTLFIHQAQVEITPPELLPLGGYTRRAGKVMDPGGEPLFARAVAFERGPVRATLVSVEMLTIPESLYRDVLKQLPAGMNLMLVATHTHCAPDSQMLNDRMTFAIPGIASYKGKWLEWYSDKIATAAKAAWAAPASAVTDFVLTQVEVNNMNRGRRDGAKPDPLATLLSASTKDSATLAFGFTFSAHATLWDDNRNTTSGDWPGAIAKKWNVAVMPGAIGDASPIAKDPTDFADKMVALFADSVGFPIGTDFGCVRTPIELGEPTPHPDFAKENKIPEALAKSLCKKFAPPEASITAWRMGSLAIVGVPGEPTSQLGQEIRDLGKAAGFKTTLVFSHVNGWVGYILEPDEYDKGGYEATLAMHGREFAGRVKAAAKTALQNLSTLSTDQ